jgi:hypothetical protein
VQIKQNNRISEFRQSKKEVRGSDNRLLVGIDIAKTNMWHFWEQSTEKYY